MSFVEDHAVPVDAKATHSRAVRLLHVRSRVLRCEDLVGCDDHVVSLELCGRLRATGTVVHEHFKGMAAHDFALDLTLPLLDERKRCNLKSTLAHFLAWHLLFWMLRFRIWTRSGVGEKEGH